MTYAIQYEPNFISLKSNMSQNKDITLDLSLPDSLKENDLSVQNERMDKETVETDLGMKAKESVEMIKSVEEEPLIEHNKTTASNEELIEPLHLYNGSCNGDKGLSLPDTSKDVLSPRTLVALASDTLMRQLLTSDKTSEHLVSKKENRCLTLESSKINGDKSVKRKLNNKEKVVPSKKIKLDKDGMCLLKDDTQGIKKEVLETNIKSEYKALSSKGVSLDDIKLNLKPVVKLPRCKSLSCGFCWRSFIRLPDLNAHLILHEQYPTDFLDHMLSVRVKLRKMFSCSKCGENFSNQREYKLHQIKHVGDETIKSLKEKKNKHYEKSYFCNDCDASFVLESTLVAHSVLHQPFPHVCHCGIGYYKAEVLERHLKVVHPGYVRVKPKWVPKICLKLNYDVESLSGMSSSEISEDEYVLKRPTTKPKSKAKTKNKSKNSISRNKESKPVERVITKSELLVNANVEKDKNGMYPCFACPKKFKSKRDLATHGLIHTGEKPYECDICQKKFTQMITLKLHKQRHAGVKNYTCPHCQKEFFDLFGMNNHIRTHTGEKPFVCKFCSKAFADQSAHGRHIRIHTGVKPYSCQLCHLRFSDASAAIQHRLRHKSVEERKTISCDICDAKFVNKDNLNKHVVTIHSGKKPYQCEVCFKLFNNKSNCKNHVKIHFYDPASRTKYECDDCGIRFIQKRVLITHVLEKHSMVHLYCSRCQRIFYSDHDFKEHKKLKCKPIRCKICDKIFCDDYKLKRHLYVHNNRRYICDYCREGFRDKVALRKHIVKEHMKPT